MKLKRDGYIRKIKIDHETTTIDWVPDRIFEQERAEPGIIFKPHYIYVPDCKIILDKHPKLI